VKSGGVAILSARSGVKDATNLNHTSPLPGRLAALAGLEISDYDAVGRRQVDIELSDETRFKSSVWCDVLDLKGAEALAIYRSDYYHGETAMAVNAFGEGRCYYIGTVPEATFYTHFLGKLLDELGIARVAGLPEGVAVARRRRGGKPILFVLNGTGESKEVPLPDGRRNLLTREKEDGALEIEAYGVRVYAV
jgi:beta-galactosidase